MKSTGVDIRVIIVAPLGADAVNISEVLIRAGFGTLVCRDLEEATKSVAEGCGVLLLTEEAIDEPRQVLLSEQLAKQQPWSDLPLIVITTGGRMNAVSARVVGLLGPFANLTLIERPLRASTLVVAMKAAMRARARQYQLRDLITDREKLLSSLEERVTERTASLRQMVEELEAFSYSVSHDLRAPLRVLEGYAQVLVEDYGPTLEPQAKELLDRIARAARRMDRLTQDVLAYTRVSREQMVMEPVELELILREVIEQYPSLYAARNFIRLRRPLGRVSGHGPSLVQCFSNLLENAIKFSREGEEPWVEISSEPRGDRLRVAVRDRGLGIDAANQKRIFGMFERATAHRQVPGTGIGLAIVKKAVGRMGGSVGVESEPGQGACFWLDLRLAEAKTEPLRR